MDKQEVESSVIGAVGHTRVLEITFESGRIYQYYDVPEDVYQGMLNAESKGRYFNQAIRGKFDFQEIALVERPRRRRSTKSTKSVKSAKSAESTNAKPKKTTTKTVAS